MEVAHIVVTLNHTAPVAPVALVPLGIAGYTLSLATNVTATTLIVYKLWWMLRKAMQESLTGPSGAARAVQSAVMIVVESGLLYLIAQLAMVVLFSLRHPAQGIAVYMAVQIYVSAEHYSTCPVQGIANVLWIHTGHRTDAHHHPGRPGHNERADRAAHPYDGRFGVASQRERPWRRFAQASPCNAFW